MDKRDIFICHASEDKEEIVRPVVEAFTQANISCWYDEAEIKWGDSITQKVNEGLSMSRYVIVVFSTSFVEKNWPQRELNSVLNLEASTGEVKVLPLIVGSQREQSDILAKYPLLNDKRYLPWDGNLRKIVEALQSRLGTDTGGADASTQHVAGKGVGLKIPLTKIKKKFTQRDRDMFLRDAFGVVKQYFQNALAELERNYQEVQTDFAEVHNFKFLCTIYVRGEVASRCKIWLGGLMTSDSIAYQSGQFNIESDNSLNDMLSVADNEQSLGFSPSHMWMSSQQYPGDEILTAEQAAEYFWRRFTDALG